MLLYCENCHIVYEGDNEHCPACGSEKTREPLPNDICFLCERQIMWGEMVEDVLKSNGIPVFSKKVLGAGMAIKVGPMMERVKIYVPFSCLQESARVIGEMFSEASGGDEA